MRITNKFKQYLADIFIKIFQIVFAMLVVGMVLKEKFNGLVFLGGIFISSSVLTMAIILYYDLSIKEE